MRNVMKPEFLHKESRNWLLLFLSISLIMTWITFALIQPAIEERDPSLYIAAGITYVMLGCLWIGAYEIPVFTGAKCANGYLIIAKSSLIPYYMYIGLMTSSEYLHIRQSSKVLIAITQHPLFRLSLLNYAFIQIGVPIN